MQLKGYPKRYTVKTSEIGVFLWGQVQALQHLKRASVILPALIGAFHFWLMARIADGDLFSSYPYISDDGFDWILQGLALNQLLTGLDASEWPVLRSPGFVLISALDDLFGSRGLIIMLAQSAAVASLSALMMIVARERGFGFLTRILLAFVPYISVTGFLHLWVLSDTIASALMAWATYAAIRAVNGKSIFMEPAASSQTWKLWILPVALFSAAGLTQTYGIIPLLVICGLHAAGGLVELFLQPKWRLSLVAGAVGAGIVFGGGFVWSQLIPHITKPTQFGLLSFGFGMLDFYRNVWAISLALLIPAVFVGIQHKFRNKLPLNFEQVSLFAICCAFGTLSLLYQWADIRFTFIYMPIAWMFVLALGDHGIEAKGAGQSSESSWFYGVGAVRTAVALCAVCSLVLGLTFVPQNYWEPKLSDAKVSFEDSWIQRALNESPRDRFYLNENCPDKDIICANSRYDEPWSAYTQKIFPEYRRRTLAEHGENE